MARYLLCCQPLLTAPFAEQVVLHGWRAPDRRWATGSSWPGAAAGWPVPGGQPEILPGTGPPRFRNPGPRPAVLRS